VGSVRSEQIKRVAKELVKKYPDKFSTDYEANKQVLAEVTIISSNKIRNQLAGYISHLKKFEQKQMVVIAAPSTAS
jgi:small subunit ribosomal protein S17e